MKKFSFILILFMLTFLPCYSESFQAIVQDDKIIFIYHIPDEDEQETQTQEIGMQENAHEDIVSDDVTADTSWHDESEINEENADNSNDVIANNEYEIGDLYTDVLKGYAQYVEGQEDEILLEDIIELPAKIYISKPFRIAAANYTKLKTSPSLFDDNKYTQYNGTEYIIAPVTSSHSKNFGKGFSAGTEYSQGIDYGELEQTSGIYSRYQYKRFALETSFKKTINTTNNNYNDNVYVTPEIKLNDYFTLKERFSNDFVKRRNKAELILSINPFGIRDKDRMRLNFGVSRTYDQISSSFKDQLNFSTSFKF